MRLSFNTDESPSKKLTEKSQFSEISNECPRCSYLLKISESQQNELLSLEEHKSTYSDIKQIIKEYYSGDHIPYATKYIPDIEDLGIDLPQPFHGKQTQVSKQEAEHLKETIVGLTEKLKNLHSVQEEVKALRQQLYDSHINRLNLQTTIKETTEQLEGKCKEQCKKHFEINEERAKAMQGLLDQQHKYAQRCLELDQLKSDLSTLNANHQQLKAEEFNFNTMKDHVLRLNTEISDSQNKKNELKSEYKKTLEDFETAKNNQKNNIVRLNKEKNELNSVIENLSKQISDQKAVNDDLSNYNSNLESEIQKLEKEIEILTTENKEIEQSRQIAGEKEEVCIKLHKDIHEAAKKFENELENLSKINNSLLKEKTDVIENLNRLENLLKDKTEDIQNLAQKNYSSLAQCTILEQQVCIQNDQNEIRKAIEAQTEMNEKIKNILLEELAQMGENLRSQSEECLSLSKSVEDYKKNLEAKNSEKNEMVKIVKKLKRVKPAYVPVRAETIDELLANVLNARDDWVAVDIHRIEQGKYAFGTKEIFLLVDDNSLVVRLGKALMSIDEFLVTYIPLEIHKKQIQQRGD